MCFILLLCVAFFSSLSVYATGANVDMGSLTVLFEDGERVAFPFNQPAVPLFTYEHMPIFAFIKNHYDEFGTEQSIKMPPFISKAVFHCVVQLVEQFLVMQKEGKSAKDTVLQLRQYMRGKCATVSKIALLNAVDYLGEATNLLYKKFLEVIIELCYDELKTVTKIDFSTINPYLHTKIAGLLLKDLLQNIETPNVDGAPALDIKLPDVTKDASLEISKNMSREGALVTYFEPETDNQNSSLLYKYYVDLKKHNFKEIVYTNDSVLQESYTIIEEGISSDGRYMYKFLSVRMHYFFYIYDLRSGKWVIQKVQKDFIFEQDQSWAFIDLFMHIIYDEVRKVFLGIFYEEISAEKVKVKIVMFDPASAIATFLPTTYNISKNLESLFYNGKPLLVDQCIVQAVILKGTMNYSLIVFDLSGGTVYWGEYDSSNDNYFYEKDGKKIVLDVVIDGSDVYRSSFIPNYHSIIKEKFKKYIPNSDALTDQEVCDLRYFKLFKSQKVDKKTKTHSFLRH